MNSTAVMPDLQKAAASIGRASQVWLDPHNAWRKEAVTAIQVSTGLSRSQVENALVAAFDELTEDKILQFCSNEPAFQQQKTGPETVLHLLAGNVFTAFLPGAVISLLLGSECHLKASTRDPVSAALWQRSVEQVDPILGNRIRMVRWDEDLLQRYPAIVGYGSGATLYALRKKIPPAARFIEYGPKFSVAILGEDVLTPEQLPWLLEILEQDVSPFDLEGCLSPKMIYLAGEDPGIFEQLFTRVAVMPELKRFESWDDLKAELQTFHPYLSALGYAGAAERIEALTPEWNELGFSRICALGEMQRPPLTWRNGGISLAEALTRS